MISGLEIFVHRGQATSQITLLARLGLTILALPSTPPLFIPRIMPPVSLHYFYQSASVKYDCISLCHKFEHLNGKTTLPSTSKGPMCKKLVSYQKLPVVNFLSTDCQIPYIGINMLRKDHQYLLDISKALKSGTCKEDLVVLGPGRL